MRAAARVVCGRVAAVRAARGDSAVGDSVNTVDVERHTGTDRNRNAREVRQGYRVSQGRAVHEAPTYFTTYSCTCCWPVRPPREKLGRKRQARLDALRRLLGGLPDDETAVFSDEVDVNLNPKVGSMWMRRGEQAAVETPGTNERRYLAGSIYWRTGRVLLTEGRPKEGAARLSSAGTWTSCGGRSATTG